MLRRIAIAATTLTLPILGCTVAHADDILPKTKKKVTTSALCLDAAAPKCAVGIQAQQDAAPAAAPVPAPPPPPPPPSCHYEQDFKYALPASVQADGAPGQMDVQHEVCPSGVQSVGTPFTFTPIAPAAPVVNIKALVDQATKVMDLPLPQASLSPDARSTQFVGLPLWMWTPVSAWVPKSVTVSAGGVSLTMTATPVSTLWSMGDGGSVTCQGPGTPYPASRTAKPPEKSPSCGYVYTAASSTSQPGGTFAVSVTTRWKVSWSTTSGLSGQEPDLTATSRLALHVSEIQALVTDVKP